MDDEPSLRNALDEGLVAALRDALATAEANGTQVVVLRGAGPSFCAGADLALLAGFDASRGATPRDHLATIWDLTLAMERSPIVLVAVLHGHAVAGGFELALACDVVIASEHTLIGDGHVRHCLLPGGGASARMERALGRGPSSWLALTGDFLPAEDPAFTAWLRAVTPVEQLDAAVARAVEQLTAVPAVARTASRSSCTTPSDPSPRPTGTPSWTPSTDIARQRRTRCLAHLPRQEPRGLVMSERYTDQVVLVTGGAQGLGRAMVERFAVEGARVHVADLNKIAGTALLDHLDDGRHAFHEVNIADSIAASSWVDQVAQEGGPDRRPGQQRRHHPRQPHREHLRRGLGRGARRQPQRCLLLHPGRVHPHARARLWPRAVVLLDELARQSRTAQLRRRQVWRGRLHARPRSEGARHGITANAIAPGLIETPMLASMNGPARDKLVSKVPMRHTGHPTDIAAAAAFLCSPEARYITGVVLDVDGGICIGSSIR